MQANRIAILLMFCLSSTSYADTGGITLHLSSPSTEMIAYEWESLSITISNNSQRAIYIVKDPMDIMSTQMVLDFDKPLLRYKEEFNFSESPKKSKFSQRQREGNLHPGEAYTWKLPPCYGDLTRACLNFGATEVTALFPIGNDQWIRSNTIPIKIYPSEGKSLIFDEPYVDNNGRESHFQLYKAVLSEKTFLFTSWGERICEISDSDTPKIHLDPNKQYVSISFRDRRKNIRYNIEKAQKEQDENKE